MTCNTIEKKYFFSLFSHKEKMPKYCCDNKNGSSSSSSSSCSSGSSSCSSACETLECKIKCKKACPEVCYPYVCEGYHPAVLCCKYKDSVVQICAETVIAPVDATGGSVTADNLRANAQVACVDGAGSLVRYKCQSYILAPASVALLPPSFAGTYNRFPFLAGTSQVVPAATAQNAMLRASRYFGTINNVNGCGRSFIYELDLLGVDGMGDLAIFYINPCRKWNKNNYRLRKCHPHLKWGCSRKLDCGNYVYALGSAPANKFTSLLNYPCSGFACGTVSNNKALDRTGWAQQELLLSDLPANVAGRGLPLVDCMGRLVAMSTLPDFTFAAGLTGTVAFTDGASNGSHVGGPSQYFMQPVVHALVRGQQSKYSCYIEGVTDPAGGYVRFKHGWLGVAWQGIAPCDYDLSVTGGAYRPRFDSSSDFINTSDCKESVGGLGTGVVGNTQADNYNLSLPYTIDLNTFGGINGAVSTTGAAGALVDSPLLGNISPGDVITHINKYPVGDCTKCAEPLANFTWSSIAGKDYLRIYYRPRITDTDGNQVIDSDIKTATVQTVCPPYLYDYPWYAALGFPAYFCAIVASDATPVQIAFGTGPHHAPVATFKAAV